MVNLSVLFISALTFASASAQAIGTDAQYVLDTISPLQANATNLQLKSQSLNALSCPQCATGTGPFKDIIPIVKGITAGLQVVNPAIANLTPLSNTTCSSADFVAAKKIGEDIGIVTTAFARTFARLSGKEQLNTCTLLPAVGQAVRTPLEELKVVLLTYYIALLIFAPTENIVIGNQYDAVIELIDLTISGYKPVVIGIA